MALADRCAAEAKRHTAMAQSLVGNRSGNFETGMSAHYTQFADLNTKSATDLQELAAYHQKPASDSAAAPPAEGARFEWGAGAPAPTDQDDRSTRSAQMAVHCDRLVALSTVAAKEATDAAAMHKQLAGVAR